jgi:hypothetical protein
MAGRPSRRRSLQDAGASLAGLGLLAGGDRLLGRTPRIRREPAGRRSS